MSKSITPVISVILLILITIIASASAYFFISTEVSDLESQGSLETFPAGDSSLLNLVSISGSKAIVRNDGTSPVTEMVVFINGEMFNYILNESIIPGEVREIFFNARQEGEDLEIKIIYNRGKTTTKISYADVNTNTSGFTNNPLPLNQPAGEEGETCSIEFTDTTPPVIGVIAFEEYCYPCLSSPLTNLLVKLNVSDGIPIKDVFYENAGANNFSLTQRGSGIYEIVIYSSSITGGTDKAYAIDWLNNTAELDLGETPSFFPFGCPGGGCESSSIYLESYNLSSEQICYGDKVIINSTYSSSASAPGSVIAQLYYTNTSAPLFTETFYLENLVNGFIWGGIYYPEHVGNYEIILESYPPSVGIVNYTLMGNVIVNNG